VGFKKKSKHDKLWLFIVSFMVMGALVDVNAQVSSLSCLFGLTCNPNPITSTGNITLKPANVTELGGVYNYNCTGTDKFSGLQSNGSFVCSADTTGSGGVSQISLGLGLTANQTPITSNATLYLKNATPSEIGGIFTSNCTSGNFVSGFNSTSGVICTDANVPNIYYNVTTANQTTFSTVPVNIVGLSFPIEANSVYLFDCEIYYNSSITTTGLGLALNVSLTPKHMKATAKITQTATSYAHSVLEYSTWELVSPTTPTTGAIWDASLKGIVYGASSSSVINRRYKSETGSGQLQIHADSFCRYERIS